MLPGEAPAGRGVPGRGPPGPALGRGPPGPACGRGAGRSAGACEENGLLPTRGARGAGLGPGVGPGRGPAVSVPAEAAGAAGLGSDAGAGAGAGLGAWAAGAAGAGAAGAAGAGAGAGGAGGACGAGLGPGLGPPPADAGLPGALGAGASAGADLPPPNASRRRRATGASTVDDADFTNSPCSPSRARTSLLVTPSSLANSCTRALPATTSPRLEATAVVGPRLGFSYDAWSSRLHGVLMFFATCSLAAGPDPSAPRKGTEVLDHRGCFR
jgi:hypothetical protein